MPDPFNLERFVAAQQNVYEQALAELRLGKKLSHWMWFIFPQLAALGSSRASTFYGIGSLEEARAFLSHDVLGPRLGQCTRAACRHDRRSAFEIFGADDVKFRSSMTLFAAAKPDQECFSQAIDQFFGGVRDAATLAFLTS